MRYNVGGVHINEAAFAKLQSEISLETLTAELPTFWGKETVKLLTGLVPVAPEVFHRVIVRVAKTPHIHATDFSVKHWTERPYYEVCTSDAIYEMVEIRLKAKALQDKSGVYVSPDLKKTTILG
jgi:hypothetical protein